MAKEDPKKSEAPKANPPAAKAKVKKTNEELFANIKAKGESVDLGGEKWDIKDIGGIDIVLSRKDYR